MAENFTALFGLKPRKLQSTGACQFSKAVRRKAAKVKNIFSVTGVWLNWNTVKARGGQCSIYFLPCVNVDVKELSVTRQNKNFLCKMSCTPPDPSNGDYNAYSEAWSAVLWGCSSAQQNTGHSWGMYKQSQIHRDPSGKTCAEPHMAEI